MTNKLKLKRTPEEEARHRLKKDKRREKRKRKQDDYATHRVGASSSKRPHIDEQESVPSRKWASSDEEDMEYGPQPASTSSHKPPPHSHYGHKPDHDRIAAEIEEKLFREKMFDAMGDDERMDSVEAHFNDFAQVPDRWRTSHTVSSGAGGSKSTFKYTEDDGFMKLDPRYMDDEEYAEWIRVGMYRKTHAEEYAEQQRKQATRAARQAEEKARRVEMARLEKEAEEERKRKKLERESRRMDSAREEYHARWMALLSAPADTDVGGLKNHILTFDDIPWPIASAYRAKPDKRRSKAAEEPPYGSINVDDLTPEAVSSFLLPVAGVVDPADLNDGVKKKEKKDRLRETFLRFHPDKFEGRFLKRFKEEDKEKVLEAIGQVSRVLNKLLGDGS